MSVSSVLAAIKRYSKWVVTAVGAVLMLLNQVLPIVPTQWQHWVTAAIAVGTLLVRDLTDLTSSSLFSSKAPAKP
jgi:squalene cyclase